MDTTQKVLTFEEFARTFSLNASSLKAVSKVCERRKLPDINMSYSMSTRGTLSLGEAQLSLSHMNYIWNEVQDLKLLWPLSTIVTLEFLKPAHQLDCAATSTVTNNFSAIQLQELNVEMQEGEIKSKQEIRDSGSLLVGSFRDVDLSQLISKLRRAARRRSSRAQVLLAFKKSKEHYLIPTDVVNLSRTAIKAVYTDDFVGNVADWALMVLFPEENFEAIQRCRPRVYLPDCILSQDLDFIGPSKLERQVMKNTAIEHILNYVAVKSSTISQFVEDDGAEKKPQERSDGTELLQGESLGELMSASDKNSRASEDVQHATIKQDPDPTVENGTVVSEKLQDTSSIQEVQHEPTAQCNKGRTLLPLQNEALGLMSDVEALRQEYSFGPILDSPEKRDAWKLQVKDSRTVKELCTYVRMLEKGITWHVMQASFVKVRGGILRALGGRMPGTKQRGRNTEDAGNVIDAIRALRNHVIPSRDQITTAGGISTGANARLEDRPENDTQINEGLAEEISARQDNEARGEQRSTNVADGSMDSTGRKPLARNGRGAPRRVFRSPSDFTGQAAARLHSASTSRRIKKVKEVQRQRGFMARRNIPVEIAVQPCREVCTESASSTVTMEDVQSDEALAEKQAPVVAEEQSKTLHSIHFEGRDEQGVDGNILNATSLAEAADGICPLIPAHDASQVLGHGDPMDIPEPASEATSIKQDTNGASLDMDGTEERDRHAVNEIQPKDFSDLPHRFEQRNHLEQQSEASDPYKNKVWAIQSEARKKHDFLQSQLINEEQNLLRRFQEQMVALRGQYKHENAVVEQESVTEIDSVWASKLVALKGLIPDVDRGKLAEIMSQLDAKKLDLQAKQDLELECRRFAGQVDGDAESQGLAAYVRLHATKYRTEAANLGAEIEMLQTEERDLSQRMGYMQRIEELQGKLKSLQGNQSDVGKEERDVLWAEIQLLAPLTSSSIGSQ